MTQIQGGPLLRLLDLSQALWSAQKLDLMLPPHWLICHDLSGATDTAMAEVAANIVRKEAELIQAKRKGNAEETQRRVESLEEERQTLKSLGK